MRRIGDIALVVVGLVFALVLTLLALGLDVPSAVRELYAGAFGSEASVARTLVRMTPLLLTGLGVLIAWRAGMYNIGGEGQYIVGGLAGACVAQITVTGPPALVSAGILAGSVIGGALFAALAGWLQVKRGVQVVISTILLNFVALQLLAWAVRGPLQEPKGQLPQTGRLPNEVMLQRFDPQTDLHSGVFLALVVAALVYVFLFWTKAGFRLRVVGESPSAARATKVNVGRTQMTAMLVSGGLCGLAGGVDYVGLIGQVGNGFSQNWGFLAIPVALLGGLNPVGCVFSSAYFGALFAGSEGLARTTVSGATVVYVIQAVAVLGFVGLFTWLERRRSAGGAVDGA